MEKIAYRMFPCTVSGKREYFVLPETESERFDLFVKDIKHREAQHKAGLDQGGLMQTLIEYSDAFGKYIVKPKTLLLDIDYTIFDEMTPRPYLKEFMERVMQKYSVHFYTAGTKMRVTEVLRVFVHQYGMNRDDARFLQRKSLTRENCPMIALKKGSGSSAEIKCFHKAAEILNVAVEDMIMLDDNPSYDNPHVSQIIQAEGFMKDMVDDDYLNRVEL